MTKDQMMPEEVYLDDQYDRHTGYIDGLELTKYLRADKITQLEQENIKLRAKLEAANKYIAKAAICLLQPNKGICDTIWLDKYQTLYEYLVSHLDVKLTGNIDKDIEALKTYDNTEV